MFEKKSEATNGTSVSTPEAAIKTAPKEVVTLRELCTELKIDPVEARVRLRAAGKRLRHTAAQPWHWTKGSAVIKEVRAIIKGDED